MSRNKKDDKVGYKKPPKSGQFKKGRSGNPKGRPKGSKNFATILRDTLHSKVTVRDGESIRTMSGLEAMMHSLLFKAIHGDARAAQLIIKQISEQNVEGASITADKQENRLVYVATPPKLDSDVWEMLYHGDADRDAAVDRLIQRLEQEGQITTKLDDPFD